MRGYTSYLIALLCIVAFPSCRKDLCYTHPHNGSLKIQVDWSLLPATYKKPAGIAVTFLKLPEQTSRLTYNFPADGGSKSIARGNYRIFMINNDYELVHIRNAEDWDTMEAYTLGVTHRPYDAAPKNQPAITNTPVRSGISAADLLMVSGEHNNTEVRILEDGETQVITLMPQSRTIPVMVRIPIEEGIQYISQARGFLSGVSPSVQLISGIKSQSPAGILFSYGSALGGRELRASFSLFGMVDGNVVLNSYKVGLEMLLIDGSVLYYEFEVNNQITDRLRQEGGEILIREAIRVDPVEPPATGEGFKPSIDDWDDEEIIIPIG